MPVITFRVSVPTSTPANAPLLHNLLSAASAIQSLDIWIEDQAPGGGVFTLQTGWRLCNRSGTILIPAMGSHDNFTFGNNEDMWGPTPVIPQRIDLDDQVLEGPPYQIQLQFYNVHASALAYCGFIRVRDPMVTLARNAALYEFLVGQDVPLPAEISPATRTPLQSDLKEHPVHNEVIRNLTPIVKPGKANDSVEHIIQK